MTNLDMDCWIYLLRISDVKRMAELPTPTLIRRSKREFLAFEAAKKLNLSDSLLESHQARVAVDI